jgi:4-aminobutyrate aminotransferase-like enzyme/Ser/Thr protein kinase RdoA (MazF antagonist)
MLESAPQFDPAGAADIARRHFGLAGAARALYSERDQNFLIEAADGQRAVLKVANALEERAFLEAQQAAMTHVASTLDFVPRVIPAQDGTRLVPVAGPDGRSHLAWAVTLVPGRPLADTPRPSPALLASLGRSVARLDGALASFDHPAVHREFVWNLATARRAVDERLDLIEDADLRWTIRRVCDAFDRHTARHLGLLPQGVIHGDLNDHNVLVGGAWGPGCADQRVTGVVDFGDLLVSYTVADLAVASAYAMLGAADPLAVATGLAAAYRAERPLDEVELGALFGLSALRLCLSACMAAEQTRRRPDNTYLSVSQVRIRRTLPLLAGISFPMAEAALREACGLDAAPNGRAVSSWLSRHGAEFAPVLDADLRAEPCIVLDWSVGSPMVDGDPAARDEPHLTPRVFGAMRDAGVRVAVGRYDEPRLLYVTPLFGGSARLTDERRTVHLGLDLFTDAGAPVYAPLAGTVHAFSDNANPLDYGPVVILRHETGDGTEFFTLYGHLSRESLRRLAIGSRIARGQRIGSLGTPEENGGWTPHLHLQVIVDLLDLGADFPGVGHASRRAMWRALCPDPNLIVGIPAGRFPEPAPTRAQALAARRAHFGGNLRLSYREPLRIARGWRQYLFDDSGRQFVDAYNNVPHVGHAHPRVARAAWEQMRVLNTNTRYLSDVAAAYAERLTALFPRPLDVCYLTNSASEANELALRLARAATGARDLIVLEAAYHGNTNTLIDVSPYKHAGPGGTGAPDWVHVAPIPDDYRGAYRRGDPDAGAKYAERVAELAEAVRAAGRPLCGFIAESWPSVGGQIVPPPGYLAEVYRHVRSAGGVCIADEVQTGLGRVGTHWWAFETQGVVPDIVVLGKPLGNGHPLAAVVTTHAIADAFDTGMEYFNTFGGNTVSCAVGLAVLDVLRDEDLPAHARRVGQVLLDALGRLAERHAVVGDVRGAGLFLGVELVRDRGSQEPAGAEAAYAANRLREMGVLVGTEGPHHNVLKIRPPLPFDETDAALVVDALDAVLAELSAT